MDINHNVKLIKESLRNMMGIFGEEGGSDVEKKLEGGSGDQEDANNQSKKEPKKDQPSSSVVNQSMFNVEA